MIGAFLLATVAGSAVCSGSPPAIDHIVVLFLENRSNDEIVGNPNAPYLTSLAQNGASCANFYALTHPSQPNYFEFFAGSNQGFQNNVNPPPGVPFSTPNLASAVIDAGGTFVSYSEGLPYTGFAGPAYYWYSRLVNPIASWQASNPGPNQLPLSLNRPFSDFPFSDFSQLPTVSFVTPTLAHSMHDNSVSTGDAWVQQYIAPYAAWAMAHNSLLIVTFDEDSNYSRNHVSTIFYGPMVRSGTIDATCTHHDLLRTICDITGADAPGQGAHARAIPGLFSTSNLAVRRTFRQGASGYGSVHDTWLDPTAPNQAKNTAPYSQAGDSRQVLIRFEDVFGAGPDRVPAGAAISSAKLILTVGGDRSTETFSLHRMLVPWADNCTWNSMVGGVSTDDVEAAAASEFEVIPNLAQHLSVFDVTSAVQSWSDGSSPNYGLVLVGEGNNLAEYRPSEYVLVNERPILDIVYDGGTPCVAFSDQPQSLSVARGQQAVFSAPAASPDPISYQWRRNGVPVTDGNGYAGAQTDTLTINPADFAHAGVYSLQVAASCITVVSNSAMLQVTCDVVPTITQQPPASVTAPTGSSVSLNAAGSASGPVQYQWQRAGGDEFEDLSDDAFISGTATPSLTISPVASTDSAQYRFVVYSDCATAASNPTQLVVICPSDFNRDGFVTGDDFDLFVAAFVAGDPGADYDQNEFVNGDDFDLFSWDFTMGC